ncbi:error-prone DNA polymerase [Actinobacteria bacterium YIM 96077]|uniref:Error-prone DNA polymerase n=1 Tax=Phytoactinopolyspora halophila TaxID=1981511 RepID=A0A329QN27_9ACTN|nr:error-prone DNA polymerase [Phytoactinopolyspora halophila]AYY12325.1 error-prone DNA polymerase [Actinobacteria bacterium YIM 96077]RAW13757.1 error-prone DNA polymerase [Phytoactinopolyspora halophila]
MGWHNPSIPWREFERALSWGSGWRSDGEKLPRSVREAAELSAHPPQEMRELPDYSGPAWAELHCHSAYSFLDGACEPEALVVEAIFQGVETLAITDHDGLYGVIRFAEAARDACQMSGRTLRTVFGAELSLGLTERQAGVPDPEGRHLLVLARDPEGYGRLAGAITTAQMRGDKGRPVYDLEELAAQHGGHWAVLTGCRKGLVPAALEREGGDAAEKELRRLVELFGRENVFVELIDHDQPLDDARNDMLFELAGRVGVGVVASNNVHHAGPEDADLAHVLAAVRARSSLDEMSGWLPANGTAHIRSGAEMEERLGRFPGVREATAELGRACAFDISLIAPELPDRDVPEGHTDASFLRQKVEEGAHRRYGPRGIPETEKIYEQLEHELKVIEDLNFPGYFLIVYEIVQFCEQNGILCQGRGSAANSAVCFALGITAVDPIKHELLFERFLTDDRVGPPDIDIDIENARREEVIQHVYEYYGRQRAAQVANVNTYRQRMALRDVARALGYSPGQVDGWSRHVGHREPISDEAGIPEDVVQLVYRMLRLPRHLSIHSGGMVLCDRPVGEVCPVEWASMPGRSVLQWDKDDCAAAGLVKFDLLGLGMLAALRESFELLQEHHGITWTLQTVPDEEPAVYDMLCDADTVGVFQVESRAQMATLPRLKPETFYDLVIEVALIRPGPIQGGSVHPFIRRKNGDEDPDYPHPLMKGALERTRGVPLFQEQMMQLAIDCANFTPRESDQLRQAMSSKRSPERIERLRHRLLAGMAENGIPADVAEDVYGKLFGFASYGFPESHAYSFAYLVYASAYLKRFYPAVFTTALLNNQPMGFYAPQTLVDDARRHGVTVRGVDINASDVKTTLEEPVQVESDHPHRPDVPQPAMRMGLLSVRNVGKNVAQNIVDGQPYADVADLVRRSDVPLAALESLATAGAFDCFGLDRREALWAVGALAGSDEGQLPGTTPGSRAPALPRMTAVEQTFADLWATGVSPDSHPVQHVRDQLDEWNAVRADQLRDLDDGQRLLLGGLITHRQRPPTAGGVVFMNVEDETGMVNVICPPGVWQRQRRIALESTAVVVDGKLERADGAINLLAIRLAPLKVTGSTGSRDFR